MPDINKLRDDLATCERNVAAELKAIDNHPMRSVHKLRRARELLQIAQARYARAMLNVDLPAPPQRSPKALRLSPIAPCLTCLVEAYGTYDAIPQPAWRDYDARLAEWKDRIRFGGQ